MKTETKNKILAYLISSGLFLLITAYLLFHLFFSSANTVVTEFALPVTDRITLSADAYVMRNEYVLDQSLDSSSASYYYSDGAKIPKNAIIASLYDDETQSHGSAVVDIDRQIEFLKKSSAGGMNVVTDTKALDNNIASLYQDLHLSLAMSDIAGTLAKSDDMLAMINKRMVITGEISGFDEQISQLEQQRSRYASSFGKASNNVVSSVSGYFYSICDGYEDIFSADRAMDMTFDEFEEMLYQSPDAKLSSSVGKIAYDYKWYLACPVSKSDLKNFKVGQTYSLIFEINENREIQMKLSKALTDTDGSGAVLIFETYDCPADFSFTRLQPVKIVQSSVSGIKVPEKALRIVDGKEGVYILYGSRVYFCEVDVIGQNDDYYIGAIPDLNKTPYGVLCVYDNIIVSGKDIFEGKVIN